MHASDPDPVTSALAKKLLQLTTSPSSARMGAAGGDGLLSPVSTGSGSHQSQPPPRPALPALSRQGAAQPSPVTSEAPSLPTAFHQMQAQSPFQQATMQSPFLQAQLLSAQHAAAAQVTGVQQQQHHAQLQAQHQAQHQAQLQQQQQHAQWLYAAPVLLSPQQHSANSGGQQYSVQLSAGSGGQQFGMQQPANSSGQQYTLQQLPATSSGQQYTLQHLPSHSSGSQQYAVQQLPSHNSGSQQYAVQQFSAQNSGGQQQYSLSHAEAVPAVQAQAQTPAGDHQVVGADPELLALQRLWSNDVDLVMHNDDVAALMHDMRPPGGQETHQPRTVQYAAAPQATAAPLQPDLFSLHQQQQQQLLMLQRQQQAAKMAAMHAQLQQPGLPAQWLPAHQPQHHEHVSQLQRYGSAPAGPQTTF